MSLLYCFIVVRLWLFLVMYYLMRYYCYSLFMFWYFRHAQRSLRPVPLLTLWIGAERGDDMVGNSHRARIFSSSCSSISSYRNLTNCSLSSNSRQQYLSQQYPPPLLRRSLTHQMGTAKWAPWQEMRRQTVILTPVFRFLAGITVYSDFCLRIMRPTIKTTPRGIHLPNLYASSLKRHESLERHLWGAFRGP